MSTFSKQELVKAFKPVTTQQVSELAENIQIEKFSELLKLHPDQFLNSTSQPINSESKNMDHGVIVFNQAEFYKYQQQKQGGVNKPGFYNKNNKFQNQNQQFNQPPQEKVAQPQDDGFNAVIPKSMRNQVQTNEFQNKNPKFQNNKFQNFNPNFQKNVFNPNLQQQQVRMMPPSQLPNPMMNIQMNPLIQQQQQQSFNNFQGVNQPLLNVNPQMIPPFNPLNLQMPPQMVFAKLDSPFTKCYLSKDNNLKQWFYMIESTVIGPQSGTEMDLMYKNNQINDMTLISFQKVYKFFPLNQFFNYHNNKKKIIDQEQKQTQQVNESNWREVKEEEQKKEVKKIDIFANNEFVEVKSNIKQQEKQQKQEVSSQPSKKTNVEVKNEESQGSDDWNTVSGVIKKGKRVRGVNENKEKPVAPQEKNVFAKLEEPTIVKQETKKTIVPEKKETVNQQQKKKKLVDY